MKTHLTHDQVHDLNEKHGWFQFGDAQSDVSRAFAQDAIEMHERIRRAAPALLMALQELTIAFENIGGEHVTGREGSEQRMKAAYAAIAEATGKQP